MKTLVAIEAPVASASPAWGRSGRMIRLLLGPILMAMVVATGLATPAKAAPKVVQLSAGAFHTCALTPSGGVKCWGAGGDGALGNGSNTDQNTPVDVTGLTTGVAAVSAGLYHTCALTTAGEVKCWGYNGYGQLGDGSTNSGNAPVPVMGLSGVETISGGGFHTCALTTAGAVTCWGANSFGQLGDGTTTNRNQPVQTVLTNGVAAITTGYHHTCALMTNGAVKCWGDNYRGQLGDGSNTTSHQPVNVLGLAGVSALAAGEDHTCALKASGEVNCWGDNSEGQLGDGTFDHSNMPVPVSLATGLSTVAAISAGGDHTCALTTNGGVMCWGDNFRGQLGNGTSGNVSNSPVSVTDLSSGVAAIAAGYYHTCALTTGGGVKCWGYNYYGELGDGTNMNSAVPVDVPGIFGPADTTAPAIVVPPGIQAEATSPAGAIVTYDAEATDPDDAVASFACTPASGSTFGLGTTTVTCTAMDSHGNSSSASFPVTVVDTTPPAITDVPSDITVAAGPGGEAVIDYTLPTATDLVDGPVSVVCTPPPGSTFQLGQTTVTCTATDTHGNRSSASFSISVSDTTPPEISDVPSDITVAAGPGGEAVVDYTLPTATDLVDGAVSVVCTPPPGSTFQLGQTTVTCTASDAHGNAASASFTVTVEAADLALSLDGPVAAVVAGDPGGADLVVHVSNLGPQANSGGYTVTGSLPSGVTFDNGTGCASAAGGFACSAVGLAAGASDTYVVLIRVLPSAAPGSDAVTATVSSTGTLDPNGANNSATTGVEITTSADLAVSMSGPGTGQPAGDAAGFDYTVTVRNDGPSDNRGGYTVAGTLPAGISFVGGAGCAAAAAGFACDAGDLAAGVSDTLIVHVQSTTATPAGTAVASVIVSSRGTTDPNPVNDSASAAVLIIRSADLEVRIDAPQVVTAGFSSDVVISVVNHGPLANEGGYTVTGSLPSGVTFTDGSGCTTASAGFVCAGGDLAAGAMEPLTVHLEFAASLPPGNVSVSVSVASNGTVDPVTSNDSASTIIAIGTAADLSVSFTAPQTPQIPGDPAGFDYTLRVANAGPSDFTGTYLVTISAPPGISLVSGVDCPASLPGLVTCNGGDLAVGATAMFTIHAFVDPTIQPGSTTSLASLSSTGTPDPLPGNETASTTVPIAQATADLAVTMLAGPSPAAPGMLIFLTVGVQNLGPSDHTGGYEVTGELPIDVSLEETGPGCSSRPGGFRCFGGVLPSGATDTFYVAVRVLTIPDPPVSASASVSTTGTPDPYVDNDSASVALDIVALADLWLTLEGPTGPLVAGDPAGFDYSIGVTNNGPSDHAGGYTVRGELPTGVSFVSGAGCSTAAGGFACSSSATLAAHATKPFSVHVMVASSFTDSSLDARATVSSSGTIDPAASNNVAVAGVAVVPRADVRAASLTSTPVDPTLDASTDPSRNSVTFRFSLMNDGPSDAQAVSIQAAGIDIDGYCVVVVPADCGSPAQFSAVPPAIGSRMPGQGATIAVRAHASPSLRHGPLVLTSSITATSTTPDPNPGNETRTVAVTVITVPDEVTNLRATPGNGNVVVSWAAPAINGGAPLDAAFPYVLTASSTGQPRTIQVPPSAVGPCLAPEARVCYDVTGLTNGKSYRINVVAVNRVGPSDAGIPVAPQANSATPSPNSAARIVPLNTALNLPATCSVATAQRPICVTQYAIPRGGGGIAAIESGVPIPAGFCGSPCAGNVGVQMFASSRSWVDPTRPIVVTITWDASLGPQQPPIYVQSGTGTPTVLAPCMSSSKANPDPCLRTSSTVGGSPSGQGYGDRIASILFTSDVGLILVAQR
jgi:alpha-tubulin suppressor-like RCC1 family protein